MITDFESGEGYFNRGTNFSGNNQGIGASSTANRVTTEAYEGIGSQEIFIDGDAEGWFLRHVSGIGSPSANPATNLALDASGYLGFWLKTDDPGMTVQVAIDDPNTADRGLEQAIIADGEWHLYEWDLSDDSQWEGWFNGDGIVTGPSVSLDSIHFSGAGQATFYLDAVSHNPLGSLGPLPGDFDLDGDVDHDDLTEWQNEFGTTMDGSDFLMWQRHYTGSLVVAVATVPEPHGLILLSGFAALGLLTFRG